VLPLLDIIKKKERNDAPQPGEIVLQRQGVSSSAGAMTPAGYAEIHATYDGKWLATVEEKIEDKGYFRAHEKCETRKDALEWIVDFCEEKTGERIEFATAIQSSYHNEWARRAYPRVTDDWYYTPIFYDALGERIVDVSGEAVAWFDDGNNLGMNPRWTEQLQRAFRAYQKPHNHRNQSEKEARLWMTWLAGEYIKKAAPDANCIWTQSLEVQESRE
jgi:hypothetical protein